MSETNSPSDPEPGTCDFSQGEGYKLRDVPLNRRLPEHLFNRVHEVIGAASMAWKPRPHDAEFRSEEAAALAHNLCHEIGDELQRERRFWLSVLWMLNILWACLLWGLLWRMTR